MARLDLTLLCLTLLSLYVMIRAEPSCELNELLMPCGGGPCEATCTNYKYRLRCLYRCRGDHLSCGCNQGFVRNSNGNCIDPSFCPLDEDEETCPRNEFTAVDSSIIEPTCDSPTPSVSDTLNELFSSEERCLCLPGYLRNSEMLCVLPSECL